MCQTCVIHKLNYKKRLRQYFKKDFFFTQNRKRNISCVNWKILTQKETIDDTKTTQLLTPEKHPDDTICPADSVRRNEGHANMFE